MGQTTLIFDIGKATSTFMYVGILQERIQDFQIEGAQKIMCTQRTSRAEGGPLSWSLEALGFRFFLMLSDVFWASFWGILMQNWMNKRNFGSKFRGGARLLHPRLDPPLFLHRSHTSM